MKLRFQIDCKLACLVTFFIFLFDLTFAQTYKDNIVKITARYPSGLENTCFGFIFSIENDTLYIVTSSDLFVEGEIKRQAKISVDYYNSESSTTARNLGQFNNNTCLLLATIKPDEFTWNNNFCYATYIEGRKTVGIIGRYGQWNDFDENTTGMVIRESEEFKIDIPSNRPGLNGAPVIYNDCIAGLVINDQGNQVTAIEYISIKFSLDKVFDLKESDYPPAYSLPYIMLGINGAPILRGSFKAGSTIIFPDSHNLGVYVQTGITSYISVRYSKNYTNLISHSYNIWSATYQFRNRINTDAIRLLLLFSDQLYNGNGGFFYEIGYNRHNPELMINRKDWARLDSYLEFNDTYSGKFYSYGGGFEINGQINKQFLIGLELSVKKYRNKYLYVNTIEPFEINNKNTWLINLNLQAGFMLGNKEKSHRFLKRDKIFPFKFRF